MHQTLTQIKALFNAHGLWPKKRFGQNFLHDHNQMAKIVSAANLQPGEHVLEVGAGTGALSLCLLEAGVKLLVVEVDRDLQPILENVLVIDRQKNVELIIADVLSSKHVLNKEVFEALGKEPYKLVANLPYNVASALLANLVTDHPSMGLAVVTVQREVADRLCAGPGSKTYGPLGILVQAMCEVERIALVPPRCFWPEPEVDSVVLRLQRRVRPLTDEPRRLTELLHRLFSKRRKQLGTILGRIDGLPPGIDATTRPEQLSIDELVELVKEEGARGE